MEVIVLRIAIASFSHEACTFCPSITTLEAWERGGIRYGESTLVTDKEGASYITGYKEAISSDARARIKQLKTSIG